MRRKIVAGNWKMNMNYEEGTAFAKTLDQYFRNKPPVKAEVIICTPFIHLAGIAEILKGGNVASGSPELCF